MRSRVWLASGFAQFDTLGRLRLPYPEIRPTYGLRHLRAASRVRKRGSSEHLIRFVCILYYVPVRCYALLRTIREEPFRPFDRLLRSHVDHMRAIFQTTRSVPFKAKPNENDDTRTMPTAGSSNVQCMLVGNIHVFTIFLHR